MSAPTAHTAFSVHAAAYWIAREGYEKHREQCCPIDGDVPMQLAYESAYQALITAMTDAANLAIQTLAASSAEVAEKLRIFDREDMQENTDAKEMIGLILADALRIGGAA